MVDKKRLREMSQDVLVIPFTEEMADKLDKFCRIQIENIEQNKVGIYKQLLLNTL